jgi:PPOX class probable F420-dependent enzyme
MNETVPESHLDLLHGPVYIQLASHMQNGAIQVNPVWCSYNGTQVWVNSAKGRVKDLNMRANPNVTIFAMDPENPYRWLEVRGLVDEITEVGADDHIDDLADLYVNQRPYPFRQEGEQRVIYKILPQRVQAFAQG